MDDVRLMTFITFAKVRKFTKTAEILNITQPAVSQHIKSLEKYYDVNLIKKQGKEFYLTEEGTLLLKYAEQIDFLYRDLEAKLKNKSKINKTYKVGATLTIGGYVLPNIIGKHKRLYNNIDILLRVENTEKILQQILIGELDFALVEGPFDKNKFQYIKYKDDELVLAVSPESIFAGKKEIDIEDIINGSLILREKGSGTRKIFENKLVELGYDLNKSRNYLEIGDINAIKSLIESNLGYSIISKQTIRREVELNTIRIVPIKGIRIYREFNFVYIEKQDEFLEQFVRFCYENSDSLC